MRAAYRIRGRRLTLSGQAQIIKKAAKDESSPRACSFTAAASLLKIWQGSDFFVSRQAVKK